MRTARNCVSLGLMLISCIALHACAPSAYEKPKIDLVWPLPPDEPKIKYVDKFASTGDLRQERKVLETMFGEEKVESLNKPYGVAVDKAGKIYITDIGRVFVFDFKNKDYSFIGTEPGNGQLATPIGIAIASDGRIFVADVTQDRVFVYQNGKYAAAIGQKGDFRGPSGVALDEKKGLLYVVNTKQHVVDVFSLKDYTKLRTIGKRGFLEGEFNFPTNITVDSDGKVYVVDTLNERVEVFDDQGTYIRTIGKLGDFPGSFARPKGIAIDSEGHVYVVDTAFQNYQIFDHDGNLLLSVGKSGNLPGEFLLPAGIAIDDEDKIYVVDQLPGSVSIFQYLGAKWKSRQGAGASEGDAGKGQHAR